MPPDFYTIKVVVSASVFDNSDWSMTFASDAAAVASVVSPRCRRFRRRSSLTCGSRSFHELTRQYSRIRLSRENLQRSRRGSLR